MHCRQLLESDEMDSAVLLVKTNGVHACEQWCSFPCANVLHIPSNVCMCVCMWLSVCLFLTLFSHVCLCLCAYVVVLFWYETHHGDRRSRSP